MPFLKHKQGSSIQGTHIWWESSCVFPQAPISPHPSLPHTPTISMTVSLLLRLCIINFPEYSQSPPGLLSTVTILRFPWPPVGSYPPFLLECLLALFTRGAPVHPSEVCQHARVPPASALFSSVNTDCETLLSSVSC